MIDLFNKTLAESGKLSTGFVQRGLINIEKELKQRGYKTVKIEGEDTYRAEPENGDAMKSFQIAWHLDDIEVKHCSGASYVKALSSKQGKAILAAFLHEHYPHAESITIGRAIQKMASREDQYIN